MLQEMFCENFIVTVSAFIVEIFNMLVGQVAQSV
jgi:hypothetical protein